MPVLGHFFVGLATAMYTKPSRSRSAATGLWLPIMVAIAYLPDIVNQAILTVQPGDARGISHSLLLALVVSIVLGFSLSRLAGITAPTAIAIVLFSILVHDGLDFLQATGRMSWWPLARWQIGLRWSIIPSGVVLEMLLFGGLFLLFLVWYGFFRHRPSGIVSSSEPAGERHTRSVWIGYAFTGMILACAVVTHCLRGVRERQLADARTLVSRGDYQAAILLAEQAQHWPRTAKPGRLEYVKAVAYQGLGDKSGAERSYLRACRSDPSYFWSLADLTVLYASADLPLRVRRRRAAPYIQKLRTEFVSNKDLQGVLDKLRRKLGELPDPFDPASAIDP